MYDTLSRQDIQQAADLLLPIYQRAQARNGFISLEVSPELESNTQATIQEAKRLFSALVRPNVMIKVPATPAGVPAIEALIGEGINVNATLIFAIKQYQAVAEAYLNRLEKYAQIHAGLSQVSSVASFFISRLDTALDHCWRNTNTPNCKEKLQLPTPA